LAPEPLYLTPWLLVACFVSVIPNPPRVINTPLLYSAFYHYPFSSGRDPSVTLTSCPFLPSGLDSIFRANTPLLYSALYYYPFSSGRNLSVILTNCSLLPLGNNFIFRANTLLLYSTLYYYPFSSGRNFLVILTSRPLLGQLVFSCF
jgi:hypothetical protein